MTTTEREREGEGKTGRLKERKRQRRRQRQRQKARERQCNNATTQQNNRDIRKTEAKIDTHTRKGEPGELLVI